MDESATGTSEVIDVQNEDCAVCLQPCVQPVKLSCGHIFCYLCIKGVSYQSRKCPLCRKNIAKNCLKKPKLVCKQQTSVAFEGTYQWFYQGKGGWWQYDDRTSMEIENAYKIGEKQCEVFIAGLQYIIDFDRELQCRKDQLNRSRRIKRDLVTIPKKGIAGIYVKRNSKISYKSISNKVVDQSKQNEENTDSNNLSTVASTVEVERASMLNNHDAGILDSSVSNKDLNTMSYKRSQNKVVQNKKEEKIADSNPSTSVASAMAVKDVFPFSTDNCTEVSSVINKDLNAISYKRIQNRIDAPNKKKAKIAGSSPLSTVASAVQMQVVITFNTNNVCIDVTKNLNPLR